MKTYRLASRYEDYDNSLEACAREVAAEYGLELWQVEADWDDEQEREYIVVTSDYANELATELADTHEERDDDRNLDV